QKHGSAVGQVNGGKHRAQNPLAQRDEIGVVAWPLFAPIVTVVLAMAVLVFVAVCFVMLLVIADDILRSEAIVRSQIIDGCPRPAMASIEDGWRTHQPSRQISAQAWLARPESANAIPILVVPLSHSGWVVAKVIAVESRIPRL